MMSHTLLIRADGGTQMGTGHLMRCLALAQGWQEKGGEVLFVLAWETTAIEERLRQEGMQVAHLVGVEAGSEGDAAATAVLARQHHAWWIVVDGYHFGGAYQKQIKDAGFSLLFIDDNAHADHYYADLVLNQNIYAQARLYQAREPYTRLLLGTSFVLLRREFWPWRGWQRPMPEVARHLLVTLGGSDSDNVTLKVIEALRQLVGEWEAVIVVGGQNPHYHKLATAVGDDPRFHLRQNVLNMPELMAWADLAIAASGSTCWELAFMGLPSLFIVLAENQALLADGLATEGAGINLGWFHHLTTERITTELGHLRNSPEARKMLSHKARAVVEGRGVDRVCQALCSGVVLRSRLVTKADMARLFAWANDPLTRQMSFHPTPISWEEHQRWFTVVLSQSGTLLTIIEMWVGDGWMSVAQVRIDEAGTVSINIAPEYRGQGLGTAVLREAVAFQHTILSLTKLVAYIKSENQASQTIFSRAGFLYEGLSLAAGQQCLKYVYTLTEDKVK
ncbi:MAG: UDP-2,4-diacetamido-2,4,6-trideoxy-beta-L-altropyranose hydrolase [Anaerolineae bacterium]|nr:UDP-2,4-diacetamido-2,4,6-trideoxy-beta-L-altropyranose hydrolase [Anaerolineae bacterium]